LVSRFGESEKKKFVVGGSWYPRSVGVVGVFGVSE
jgi:hypothetical protein